MIQQVFFLHGRRLSPKFPFLIFKDVPVEGTFTHKAEGSLTVSHTGDVCDSSEERAARDLCFLRKTGTRRTIRHQDSKFRVLQRCRGKTRHLVNDFNNPDAEICILWEQTPEHFLLLLLTHKLIFVFCFPGNTVSLGCFSKSAAHEVRQVSETLTQ